MGPTCNPDWCGPDSARTGAWYLWWGGWGVANTAWISQSLTACHFLSDLPWLSVAPAGGDLAAGGANRIDVTFDAGGLTPGAYTATLCIESDEPHNALVRIPATLTVANGQYLPLIFGGNE